MTADGGLGGFHPGRVIPTQRADEIPARSLRGAPKAIRINQPHRRRVCLHQLAAPGPPVAVETRLQRRDDVEQPQRLVLQLDGLVQLPVDTILQLSAGCQNPLDSLADCIGNVCSLAPHPLPLSGCLTDLLEPGFHGQGLV